MPIAASSLHPRLRLLPHPLGAVHLGRLRDARTPPDAFRRHLDELSRLLVADALSELPLQEEPILTPLGPATGARPGVRVEFVPVLRAGLGMVPAATALLPDAVVRHLGIRRDEHTLEASRYYHRLEGRAEPALRLILDPMLATGGSACAAAAALRAWGATEIAFVGVVGAPEGLTRMAAEHPDLPVLLAAVDEGLDARGFIVPGLGDAGDRQFATD